MLNPHMAEDITILEQYLTGQSSGARFIGRLYNTIQTTSTNPVVYLRVPRVRKGLRPSLDPGRVQREIMEQVLSPHATDVRQLYFDFLHPCFPILDEETFSQLWLKDDGRISPTLICDIYAISAPFWEQSDVLRRQPRPDLHFLWNNAVTALKDDFMEPTISTLLAALLDMMGRPVGAVTGNIVNSGRVVTLAQSLGLHRDPTPWHSSKHEKNMRIRVWWGVFIHDSWSSIGHGIPPNVNSRYCDVPMVTPEMFNISSMSESLITTTATFTQLCKLTVILSDTLPYVYFLAPALEEMWRQLRRTECALDDWVSDLPQGLRYSPSSESLGVNGGSNLWFAYLSIKLLVCRLALKATLREVARSSEARQYRLSTLREAACELVTYVTLLKDANLQEFWLPYTSYLLVTAATTLLRCTVECGDIVTKRSCITKLVAFRNRLRKASDDSRWDLADFCLERCDEPIQRIADALKIASRDVHHTAADTINASVPNETVRPTYIDPPLDNLNSLSDFSPPLDSLGFSWDTLWDTYDGSWPSQT